MAMESPTPQHNDVALLFGTFFFFRLFGRKMPAPLGTRSKCFLANRVPTNAGFSFSPGFALNDKEFFAFFEQLKVLKQKQNLQICMKCGKRIDAQ